MALWKLGLVPLCLASVANTSWADEPTALDRLRATEASGKLKEIDVGRTKVDIQDATPIDAGRERRVLTPARLVEPEPTGTVAPPVFHREIGQKLWELPDCRSSVAASSGRTTSEVKAGTVLLRFSIEPDGRTRNTAVLQDPKTPARQATDMDLMRCVRKRMEAWQFTPPVGGPAAIDYWYSFAPIRRASTAGQEPPAREGLTPAALRAPAVKQPPDRK